VNRAGFSQVQAPGITKTGRDGQKRERGGSHDHSARIGRGRQATVVDLLMRLCSWSVQ
jgi:hypothetical protein